MIPQWPHHSHEGTEVPGDVGTTGRIQMPADQETLDHGQGQRHQMPTTQALVPFHTADTTSHPGHPIAETMIREDSKTYREILYRASLDAHQFDDPGTVLIRITDRIWVFQNYHVVEIDHEQYVPRIVRNELWQDIRSYLNTRTGVGWLCSRRWPTYFQKHLLVMVLQLDEE